MNPFIINGEIANQYFCDRKIETEQLLNRILNQHNVVLMSPRRMGKTGLIYHCYQQPELKDDYYLFFVDILSTASLTEFTYCLGKQIYETLKPFGRNVLDVFIGTLKSLQAEFGYDVTSGLPKFNLSLGSIRNPEYTLDEIFRYIDLADKRCIVAIDEFQQIANYPEKGIEAMLRTHIQHCSNATFIFAGSERHILSEMFISHAKPFYQSATIMSLDAIPLDVYSDFVVYQMAHNNISIDSDVVESVYNRFRGNTYCIQKVFNVAYSMMSKGEHCDMSVVDAAIENILADSSHVYRLRLSLLSPKIKEVLYAIAADDRAKGVTSGQFIRHHHLDSASSVQSAIKQLMSEDWITYDLDDNGKKEYYINDPFLSYWLRIYVI